MTAAPTAAAAARLGAPTPGSGVYASSSARRLFSVFGRRLGGSGGCGSLGGAPRKASAAGGALPASAATAPAPSRRGPGRLIPGGYPSLLLGRRRLLHRSARASSPTVLEGRIVSETGDEDSPLDDDRRPKKGVPSSAANEFVRAELSALLGDGDDSEAYEELVRALHSAMERMHVAVAREAELCGAAEGGGEEEESATEAREDAIEALRDVGKAHWDVGMLDEAREAYEDALRRAIDLHGSGSGSSDDADVPDHPSVASLLHLLGNVHARSDPSDPSEATRWYESSLAMKKRLYGNRTYHPEIGRTLNGLAMLRIHAAEASGGKWDGRLSDADSEEELAIQLLEEAERNYVFYKYDRHKHKPEHAEGAAKTTRAQQEEGEHDETGDLADHPDVGHINENLANIYRSLEKYDLALGRYVEALRIKELWMPSKSDGASVGHDPKAMTLILAAADCLGALGRHDEACGRYEDALEDHRRAVRERAGKYGGGGGTATKAAADADADADAEREDGEGGSRLSSSLTTFASSEDEEEEEPLGTPLEAVLLHNVALMHSRCGRHDLALSTFRRSLALKRRLAGESHPEVAATLNAMGALYGTRGERQSALVHFREALYIYRLSAGGVGFGGDEDGEEDDPDVAEVKRNIALVEKRGKVPVDDDYEGEGFY